MPQTQFNGPARTNFTGNTSIDAILWGWQWASPNLTFRFPQSASEYAGYIRIDSFTPFNALQQQQIQTFGFGNLSAFSNLTFTPTSNFGDGNIRFAQSAQLDTGDGNLHFPGFGPTLPQTSAEATPPDPNRFQYYQYGDNWFSIGNYTKPVLGSFQYAGGLLHEMGHAIGLSHGHATLVVSGTNGTLESPILPANENSQEFSVMTYSQYIGQTLGNGAIGTADYPWTYMLNDVAAIQYMYGANFNSNAGDTTYRFDPVTGVFSIDGNGFDAPYRGRILLTLWDGGGNDTYDFSNHNNNQSVDLRPGGWSTFSTAQLANLNDGAGASAIFARGNLANAYLYQGDLRSLIENVNTGNGDDVVTGNQVRNIIQTGDGSDVVNGLNGGDSLFGGGGNDKLDGGNGNDELGGGTGADLLIGGAGNDTFYVDNSGDTTIEMAGQGTDSVFSSVSFLLWIQSQHIEALTLIGAGNIDGGGNGLANTIVGNAGNNVLNGGGNADRMVGGQGNDTYHVDHTGDTTIEFTGQGTDTVFSSVSYYLWDQSQHIENLTLTGAGNINGGGNGLANTINGNSGDNVLNGGGNADVMVGGQGNDTYHVDHTGDTTVEVAGQGTDTVISSISFGLWEQSQFLENLTLIGAGNIDGTGNSLANTITGNSGNNILNGGGNADRMVGGEGNDTYHVDNAGDTTVEVAGQGADTVISGMSFALRDQNQFLENLTLAGGGNINGTGNGLANTINGNWGNNILNGAYGDDTLNGGYGNDIFQDDNGADRMVGGHGDDTYYVDNIGDTTVELAGQGADTVISSISFGLWEQSQFLENLILSGSANINGTGNSLANTITGNAGNNVLNGGLNADRMVGGQGNDTYYVDNAGDATVEFSGQGTDTVISSISFGLWQQSQFLENLTLTGGGNINGTGNSLANTITGNSGNNVLNGGLNADRMVGGQGNDTYYVDHVGDATVEFAGQGTDTVISSVSFALRDQSNFIENLTLAGAGNIHGTGNGLANTITGNSGNNGLNGAWGNDTLIGGAGNDTFRDDAGNDIFTGGAGADTFFFLSAGESDRITDFENGIDTMTIGLGVNSFANITVTDSGADAILSFGTNTVTLENFDHTLVSSDDFAFV